MERKVYIVCEHEISFDCMLESYKPIKVFNTEKDALDYQKEYYLFDYEVKEIPFEDNTEVS